jgi:hypothetical protein
MPDYHAVRDSVSLRSSLAVRTLAVGTMTGRQRRRSGSAIGVSDLSET